MWRGAQRSDGTYNDDEDEYQRARKERYEHEVPVKKANRLAGFADDKEYGVKEFQIFGESKEVTPKQFQRGCWVVILW